MDMPISAPPGLQNRPGSAQQNSSQTRPTFDAVQSTSQPLWSLYPTQLASDNGGTSTDISPFPINQVNTTVSQDTDSSDDQFLSFAGETQQQRRSLMLQQTEQQFQQRPTGESAGYQTDAYDQQFGYERGRKPLRSIPPHQQYLSMPAVSVRSHSVDSRRTTFHHPIPHHSRTPLHQVSNEYDRVNEQEESPLMVRRRKYKAKSSIPPDLSSSNYARQCATAATSSRLDPYRLHIDEYNILRSHLSYIHVTTYLNIRNGILRLWLSNPIVDVTMAEAAGCVRDERFYGLAEFAYEWLVRNGYINFGCVEYPVHEAVYNNERQLKPRPTIVVIGAGIAGLGCARQLDNLVRRFAQNFSDYEDVPRIVLLEGRRRIGGRVFSAPLKTDHNCTVDLGAHVIMGFGDGNPLSVLVRRQLGLPIVPMEPPANLFDEVSNAPVDETTEQRVHRLYSHVVKKMGEFRNVMPKPSTAEGDQVLMKAAKDPTARDEMQEHQTIAKLEENGELPKQYEDPGYEAKFETDEVETIEELKFLHSIGIDGKDNIRPIHVAPEPPGAMYPSLGQTLTGLIKQLEDVAELTPRDIRLLNWYFGNLEYSTGANLDKLSLSSWNQDDGNDFSGRHSAIRNGFVCLARGLYVYPEKLDVRFKTSVKVIEYFDDYSEIFLENGERINADRVVVTVPLGVLKERSIQFIPDLPHWKTDSIERLGFGVTNKVTLIYQEAFWDESRDIFCLARGPKTPGGMDPADFEDVRGEFYMFWNCSKAVGKPCLVGLLTGKAALNVANEPDDLVVEKAQSAALRLVPNLFNRPVRLVESVVTRWQIDPFSRGSYSYVGVEATGADYDLMARPINRSVYFAGEATCRTHPGTVHGAYLSGLRVANEVLASMIGEIEVPYPLIPPKEHHIRSHYPTATSSQVSSSKATPMLAAAPNPRVFYDTYNNSTTAAAAAAAAAAAPTTVTSSSIQDEASRKRRQDSLGSAGSDLRHLKEDRIAHDNERMRHDLIKELGERPVKPERCGANPFLIFQKDFWEQCRRETDNAKQNATGDANAKAARNEVRAALGKMWREFPDDKKKPYLEETASIKEENNKKTEEFRKKVKQYDSEAEDFRRRWKEANATSPSEEELKLMRIVEEDMKRSKLKRARRTAL
jgi:monoamine oxidase